MNDYYKIGQDLFYKYKISEHYPIVETAEGMSYSHNTDFSKLKYTYHNEEISQQEFVDIRKGYQKACEDYNRIYAESFLKDLKDILKKHKVTIHADEDYAFVYSVNGKCFYIEENIGNE